MGAVSLAQRGGILGSSVYETQKPNVDIAGAIGGISQALTAQREGAIQRAYLQNQMARQSALDARAAAQEMYEREFQGKQLEQSKAIAQGTLSLKQQEAENEADYRKAHLETLAKIAEMQAASREAAAKTSAGGRVQAAEVRGPIAGNSPDARSAKSMGAAQKAYQGYIKQFMAPQVGPGGVKTSGMSFQVASQAAREAVRESYPDEANQLWGAEAAPGAGAATAPTNITQGETAANAAYTQRYKALDPKDPKYSQKKADLDNALQSQLQQVHSQPPQPLPQPGGGAGMPGAAPDPNAPPPSGAPAALPTGDPSDNDQEP